MAWRRFYMERCCPAPTSAGAAPRSCAWCATAASRSASIAGTTSAGRTACRSRTPTGPNARCAAPATVSWTYSRRRRRCSVQPAGRPTGTRRGSRSAPSTTPPTRAAGARSGRCGTAPPSAARSCRARGRRAPRRLRPAPRRLERAGLRARLAALPIPIARPLAAPQARHRLRRNPRPLRKSCHAGGMTRPVLALLFLAHAAAALADLPAQLEIAYEIQRNGTPIAEITAHLERNGASYQLTESWKGRGIFALLGKAKRTSQGTVGPKGVQPREFTHERSGRATARAMFDWKAKTLTSRYKGKTRSEPIPPNAQDRLSYILAMALSPAGSKTLDVHLADGRGVSHHIYEFAGRERVSTPAGDFDAIKVVRGKENDRTEIWLAIPLGNLPVRMLVIDKGNRGDQFATRISR